MVGLTTHRPDVVGLVGSSVPGCRWLVAAERAVSFERSRLTAVCLSHCACQACSLDYVPVADGLSSACVFCPSHSVGAPSMEGSLGKVLTQDNKFLSP